MTGMEQNLRYIEREIRFMVKDQYGNPTYAKYADRVIEDACGIPNFCSTVLSSKKPLTAILRAVRGPRGDIIMRFFNVSLHDTRIEMVMVLAEVAKLRMHNNRKSRNAHDYFMKLYRKANKRMIRMITGSKNKESFKSMYRGLRDFAKMDDYDYDEDDDDDEIDDYFDNVNEFGDSDYAQACLEAYRDGKTPPEIDLSEHLGGANPYLMGNEEILREIATIEAKLGRHLSDAELDKLLCGDDDDDDDIYRNINAVKQNSDEMIDSIVNVICDRLAERLGIVNTGKADNAGYESLDDFIDRESFATEVGSTEVGSTQTATPKHIDIPQNPSTEALIGIHNRLKNDVPVETVITTSDADTGNADANDETAESNSLPPSDELGGKYNEADFIDVDIPDEESEDSDEEYNSSIDNEESSKYDTTTEGLVTSPEECSPHMQHQLILSDIINDCRLASAQITNSFDTRLRNYFARIGIEVTEIFISVVPSNRVDKLFTLVITIRVNGDYEIINMMHLNTVILMHVKNIAERFDISDELIDTEFNIIDSGSSYDSDLKVLNTLNKNYTSQTVDNVYSAVSAISTYIYRRINKLIEVRFINDPRDNKIDLYFFSKSDDHLDADFEEFYRYELDGEGILNEIFDSFNIDCSVIYHLDMNDNDSEEFFKMVRQVIGFQIIETPLATKYITSTKNFINQFVSECGITIDTITTSTSLSTGHSNIMLDLIYRIYVKQNLTNEQKDELAEQYEINGEYSVQLENVLRAITMNSQVTPYIEYCVLIDDEDSSDNDDVPMTSNFGL